MDKYYSTTEISKLLNPPLASKYFQKQIDCIEDLYPSRKKAPLGRSHPPDIPNNTLERRFGAPTPKEISAADLIYPTRSQIYQSEYAEIFHFKKPMDHIKPAGTIEDVRDDTGKQMKEIFQGNRDKNSAIIVPSSYAKKINSDVISQKAAYGVNGQEHQEFVLDEQINEAKGKKSKKLMRERNFVEVLWNLLKKRNHTNFKDLISAFRSYQNGDNKITALDLQKMCQKFGISAPMHVIEQLLKECDIIDKDGALSYEEFIHCLNWKDLLTENSYFGTPKYANDWREGINNPSDDIIDHFKTVSSFIGDHKHSVHDRAAGLQCLNKEVGTSKTKGVSEFNEFGDASSMIQPNSFSKYGVFEEDLCALHTKEKIKGILTRSGIKFSEETFEKVWQSVNQNGKASIGMVWNTLKTMCLSAY